MSPNLTVAGRVPSVLRVCVELVGWVTAPWALSRCSVWLVPVALVVLIVVPGVFATPGDKKDVPVAVPGVATIAMMVSQLVAAGYGAWALLPVWAVWGVSVLVVVTIVAELPRWRWLLGAGRGRV
ncbi:hypothetical protein EBN03_08845 [Nocardia stercoris]|uniref:Uncharacterized protein n=1 Tax=Nocardia stercoris TaxID=2483361 RepID=A0A3M2L999_9NOCA|nr:hypothetical protein EBN03_08845 [Nocardia stercoris]